MGCVEAPVKEVRMNGNGLMVETDKQRSPGRHDFAGRWHQQERSPAYVRWKESRNESSEIVAKDDTAVSPNAAGSSAQDDRFQSA